MSKYTKYVFTHCCSYNLWYQIKLNKQLNHITKSVVKFCYLIFSMKNTCVLCSKNIKRTLLQKLNTISKESHSLINFEPNKDLDINQRAVPWILCWNIRTTKPPFYWRMENKRAQFIMLYNRDQATKNLWNTARKNLFNKKFTLPLKFLFCLAGNLNDLL